MASRAFHYILTPHSPIKEGQHSTSLQSKSEKTTANFKKPPGGGADHHSGRPNYIVVTLRPRPTFFLYSYFHLLRALCPMCLAPSTPDRLKWLPSRGHTICFYRDPFTLPMDGWMAGWLVGGWAVALFFVNGNADHKLK